MKGKKLEYKVSDYPRFIPVVGLSVFQVVVVVRVTAIGVVGVKGGLRLLVSNAIARIHVRPMQTIRNASRKSK